MHVRVALTETDRAAGGTDAFVVAWPLDNDPAHTNAGAAAAIQREVGGLPVVVVALEGNGELHGHGRIEHVLALIDAGLDGHTWVMFEVDLPTEASVAKLRPLRSGPDRLAA